MSCARVVAPALLLACLAGGALASDKAAFVRPAAQSVEVDSGRPGANAIAPPGRDLRGPGNGCNLSSSQCQERTNVTINDPRASNSSFANGFAVADNFQPASATNLTSICWWGYYGPNSVNGAPPTAGAEGFRIRIYTNSQGVPQPPAVAEFFVGTNFVDGTTPTAGTTLTRSASLGTATGAAVPVPNPELYAFTATIPPLALTAQCYWLEISAGSVGNVDQRFRWVEATNAVGPNDLVTLQTPANPGTYAFSNIVNSFDRAFCLGFAAPTALASPSCSVPPPASNNSCANATAVAGLPFTTTGATYRSAFSAVPFCGGNPVNAPAVFYRVVGDGTTLTASTCGTTTDFDTVINVYCSTVSTGSGSAICGAGNANLRCVGNNDTGPATCTGAATGDPSQFSWRTVAGQAYVVTVYGFESAIGSFDFSITSDGVQSGATGACSSDRCPLDISGVTNVEVDACGTGTASTNSSCAGTGVGRFILGQPFAGRGSNDPVTTAAGGTRDFDFWEYNDTAGGPLPDNTGGRGFTWLNVAYRAEFPGVFNFFNGACDAANGGFIGGAFSFYTALGTPATCQDRTIILQTNAGQPFRLNLLPVDFGGIPCAAGNNNYRITVSLSPTGACCVPAAGCVVTIEDECTSDLGGTYQGDATACSPDPCTAATSVVCCRGTTCAVIPSDQCTLSGPASGTQAVARPALTSCTGASNTFSGCCYADYDKNGSRTIDDIFIYLNGWFANSPYTQVGGDGTGSRTIDDIFLFLNAWFSGCNP